jgi:nucleotide-binding universal stress UspA family protein
MSEPVSPVVVGVDGTHTAVRAARWAAAVAAKLAPLTIVHADPPLATACPMWPQPFEPKR